MKSTRPVAVITGAARGIGKGCALELARGGFNLLINDRPDADSVEKLHAEEMLDAAQNQWGRLDCLLNNAGISVKKRGDLLDLEPDSFDQNIAINTRAPFFLAQAFSKRLLAQPKPEAELPHRSIIFVSSINAIMLAMNRGEYTIAKTAVSAAARLFAARLCNEQIGVYEVRPGLIKTDMTIPATAYYDELIAKGLVPWGRWGYPADIASTVRAMAEGKLIYTCGQAVAIDGGLSMPRF
ncbi:TPA: 3-ketoacyl-ACP reductase [Escherichia coli]|uniref:3-ketoacyl-ACP reductase n=1 Tax=Escherichia coli TaxID=562 RepID=A0A7A7AY10_ECOLX|nr:3-ketoacyl-ACP reductase [Escherichia coli]ELQ7771264.1 3-ketoacyl-ACP reductase [Escherichia coli]ELT1847660.1 3-ketoacyl-ACP reductase [Escherichia coli]MBJ0155698.1 3-ketoacyl-ACP reductase [Escherichia coli]MCS1625265.1 3-ketoacyl-ACP reductase [Escherichia coli]MCS1714138.1 3-ketoacyl-ACP reductase [Escherichia coli]